MTEVRAAVEKAIIGRYDKTEFAQLSSLR